ncbi:MAG: hypothetical protein HY817_02440 [Candidatus Abawacabacteria bacterium]|nr:hypothetical protein [Candidatus Abawacabacteria bacterium]
MPLGTPELLLLAALGLPSSGSEYRKSFRDVVEFSFVTTGRDHLRVHSMDQRQIIGAVLARDRRRQQLDGRISSEKKHHRAPRRKKPDYWQEKALRDANRHGGNS